MLAYEISATRFVELVFLVLFSYYVLKPVRDALATETRVLAVVPGDVSGGVCRACPYWKIVARTTRRQLVFGVYRCCLPGRVAVLLVRACRRGVAALAFFVWVSVFNLYVVAVFWSVMADLFSAEEGKTWFGGLAAAGTAGSIAASLVGGLAAQRLGLAWLMVVAIGAEVIDRDGVAGLAIRAARRWHAFRQRAAL